MSTYVASVWLKELGMRYSLYITLMRDSIPSAFLKVEIMPNYPAVKNDKI